MSNGVIQSSEDCRLHWLIALQALTLIRSTVGPSLYCVVLNTPQSLETGSKLLRSKTIYVFRCGTTALFALTADRTGQSLPSQICGQAGWTFEGSVTLQPEKDERFRESMRATMAAIAKHGLYLTHSAIHTLPINYPSYGPGEDEGVRFEKQA